MIPEISARRILRCLVWGYRVNAVKEKTKVSSMKEGGPGKSLN